MKTNVFMIIIASAFFALTGLMAAQYYTDSQAIKAGLQQCVVMIEGRSVDKAWVKDCNQVVLDVQYEEDSDPE